MNLIDPSKYQQERNSPWFTPGRFALGLLMLLAIAYPTALAGLSAFAYRDYCLFGYPLAYYHKECFWHGEIPLWNPLNNCGQPYLAQWNTLILYPLSFIYLLLPMPWSLNLFGLGHLWLAGMGMYFLARRWTGNNAASAVAGVAIAFNGLAMNFLLWPNNVGALGWMPWVILFGQRAWQLGGRNLAFAAAVLGVQFLSGGPEVILLTWIVLGVVWLGEIRFTNFAWAVEWARLRHLTIIGVLGGALVAIQMLPFLELLSHSQRNTSYGSTQWAMPAWGWANLIVPLFHCYSTKGGVFHQDNQFWVSTYYFGICTLALALLAACRARKDQRVLLLAACAAFCLTMGLGENSLVYQYLRKWVPQIGFLNFPVKWVVPVILIGPLLAAVAIHQVQQEDHDTSSRLKKILVAIGIIFSLCTLGLILWAYNNPIEDESWKNVLTSGLSRLAFLWGIIAILLVRKKVLQPRARLLLQLALPLIIWMDAWSHTNPYPPTTEPTVYVPNLLKLDPQPAAGVSRLMVSPKAETKMHTGITADFAKDCLLRRYGQFDNCNLLDGVAKVNGFYSLYLQEERHVRGYLYPNTETDTVPGPLADFLGVSQITTRGETFKWTARTNWMPLVTAGQGPMFADVASTLNDLSGRNFKPREQVYLPLELYRNYETAHQAATEIQNYVFSAHRIEFDATSEQPTMAVIAQAFYPEWQAYIDSQSATLWRANHAFQAVRLPGGKHHVSLVYEDRQFIRGLIISTGALLACLVAVVYFHRRKHFDSCSLSSAS